MSPLDNGSVFEKINPEFANITLEKEDLSQDEWDDMLETIDKVVDSEGYANRQEFIRSVMRDVIKGELLKLLEGEEG